MKHHLSNMFAQTHNFTAWCSLNVKRRKDGVESHQEKNSGNYLPETNIHLKIDDTSISKKKLWGKKHGGLVPSLIVFVCQSCGKIQLPFHVVQFCWSGVNRNKTQPLRRKKLIDGLLKTPGWFQKKRKTLQSIKKARGSRFSNFLGVLISVVWML